MSGPDPLTLPGIPRNAEGPVFAEPWQAQAFALTLSLHQAGVFSWSDWAGAISEELARDPHDDGSRYYDHWLAALERLALGAGLTAPAELRDRTEAWRHAYEVTPHGHPVELGA